MNMTCAKCGGPIPRQRGSGAPRKYCPTCSPKRIRPDRDRKAVVTRPEPVTLPAMAEDAPSGVHAALLREVRELGMQDHWLGVLALHVAWRLDNSQDENGGAVASLAKCFRETVQEMRAAAPKPEEPSLLEQMRRQNRERAERATGSEPSRRW